ncbi:hypothetical protein M427DRAFT_156967 [Gonapodya prolifera JEL478]|uniref:Sulphur transport domain-containing protein n=1 Tax=Gonapodya prolifera (strain JEL478) TaxID=1344416 RepID=A0A139A810_GONPJ|nr:hypothetical protein M427DRAFT_156967 [Gonapodya prolifera JEL478]|eukprot:KXS12932.1 hypothetical protein M427DRAFT_156967 [Gonapodya prolifera JEL478]
MDCAKVTPAPELSYQQGRGFSPSRDGLDTGSFAPSVRSAEQGKTDGTSIESRGNYLHLVDSEKMVELHVPAEVALSRWQVVRPLLAEGLTLVLVGLAFGFFVQKGRAYEPKVMQDQMLLRDFTMMKMFLSACAAAQFCFSILDYFDVHGFRKYRLANQAARNSRGVLAVAIGSGLLGVSMTISGACPTTLYSQVGSGVNGSFQVLLGSVLGTLLFTLAEPFMAKRFFAIFQLKWKGIDGDIIKLPSYVLAPAFAAGMLGFCFVLDHFAPSSHGYENAPIGAKFSIVQTKSWHPMIAGSFIGLLQLPSYIFAGQLLGSSVAFVSLLSPFGALVARVFPMFKATEAALFDFPSKDSILSMLFILAMATGSTISAVLGGTLGVAGGYFGPGIAPAGEAVAASAAVVNAVPLVVPGLGPWGATILGGALSLFGSRVAKGCTVGHGLSGFALLSTIACVAIPSIFVGGIVSAQVLRVWVRN